MGRHGRPWYRESRDAWYAEIDGRQKLLAKGRHAKAEAHAEYARLIADQPRVGVSLTYTDVCALFLIDLKARVDRDEASQNTYDTYSRHAGSSMNYFGNVPVRDLKPHQVLEWVDSHDWGPTSRHNAIRDVKGILNWAVERGHLPANPVARLKKPTPKRRDEAPSPEEVEFMIAHAGGRHADLIKFLAWTGARLEEAASAQALDLSEDGKVLLVKHKTRRKTGQEKRPIFLSDQAATLVACLAEEHPVGPLLRNDLGNKWTRHACALAFARLAKRTGRRKWGAHSLRHYYVTQSLVAGVSPEVVAALVGHTTAKMTLEVYSQIRDRRDFMLEAAARASALPRSRGRS
jgi:integrase